MFNNKRIRHSLYCKKKIHEHERYIVGFSLAYLPNMDLLITIFKLDTPIAGSLLIFKQILTIIYVVKYKTYHIRSYHNIHLNLQGIGN